MEKIEKFNQIIDEAYLNYSKNHFKIWEPGMDYESKESFINKCKTDNEFSQRWGLKIDERELTLEERLELWYQKNQNDTSKRGMWEIDYTEKYEGHKKLNLYGIPRKQITLRYNDETIITYE